MPIDSILGESVTALGNDGGHYYIAQRDPTDTLWWYGEHPSGNWAHVYRGELSLEGTGARWSGVFIDVPKGLTCGRGELDWERLVVGSIPVLQRTRATAPFGGTLLARNTITPASVAPRRPGFVGHGLENLTGVWRCNDGGTYYIREVSATGEVAWVGEHPQAEAGPGDVVGNRWVNVFMGRRERTLIRGEWSDVPKGEVDQFGEMTILVHDDDQMTILFVTGGFGGRRFVRVQDIEISLQWVSLTVADQQEWFFEGDEPYFLALVAVMDGGTVDLTNPSRAAVDLTRSFIAPMLQSNVGAGTVIDLSSLPPIELGIRPVPGAGPDSTHPVFGIALRGVERDDSPDAWRENLLDNWRSNAASEINRSLARGDLNFARDVGRIHVEFSWNLLEDDLFGLASNAFSYARLQELAGRTERLTFDLRGGDVRYVVTADLTVRGVRGRCSP